MIWTWRGWRAGGPGPGRTVWYWCWTRSHSRACRWPSGAPVCKLHGRRPQTVPEARSDKPASGFSWSHCRHRKRDDKGSIWTCSNPNQDPGTSDYIQVKPYPPVCLCYCLYFTTVHCPGLQWWNKLPIDIRAAETLHIFHHDLLLFLNVAAQHIRWSWWVVFTWLNARIVIALDKS